MELNPEHQEIADEIEHRLGKISLENLTERFILAEELIEEREAKWVNGSGQSHFPEDGSETTS